MILWRLRVRCSGELSVENLYRRGVDLNMAYTVHKEDVCIRVKAILFSLCIILREMTDTDEKYNAEKDARHIVKLLVKQSKCSPENDATLHSFLSALADDNNDSRSKARAMYMIEYDNYGIFRAAISQDGSWSFRILHACMPYMPKDDDCINSRLTFELDSAFCYAPDRAVCLWDATDGFVFEAKQRSNHGYGYSEYFGDSVKNFTSSEIYRRVLFKISEQGGSTKSVEFDRMLYNVPLCKDMFDLLRNIEMPKDRAHRSTDKREVMTIFDLDKHKKLPRAVLSLARDPARRPLTSKEFELLLVLCVQLGDYESLEEALRLPSSNRAPYLTDLGKLSHLPCDASAVRLLSDALNDEHRLRTTTQREKSPDVNAAYVQQVDEERRIDSFVPVKSYSFDTCLDATDDDVADSFDENHAYTDRSKEWHSQLLRVFRIPFPLSRDSIDLFDAIHVEDVFDPDHVRMIRKDTKGGTSAIFCYECSCPMNERELDHESPPSHLHPSNNGKIESNSDSNYGHRAWYFAFDVEEMKKEMRYPSGQFMEILDCDLGYYLNSREAMIVAGLQSCYPSRSPFQFLPKGHEEWIYDKALEEGVPEICLRVAVTDSMFA